MYIYWVIKDGNIYKVVEESTGHVIAVKKKKSEGQTLQRLLCNGRGFCGYTPTFFAINKGHQNDNLSHI